METKAILAGKAYKTFPSTALWTMHYLKHFGLFWRITALTETLLNLLYWRKNELLFVHLVSRKKTIIQCSWTMFWNDFNKGHIEVSPMLDPERTVNHSF